MTYSQKRKVKYIKDKLENDNKIKNQKYNTNSIVLFEEIIENEFFVTLKSKISI